MHIVAFSSIVLIHAAGWRIQLASKNESRKKCWGMDVHIESVAMMTGKKFSARDQMEA